MNKMYLFMMTLFLLLSSCDKDDVPLDTGLEKDSEIFNMIADFQAGVTVGSRAIPALNIVSVDTRHYRIESDTVVESLPTKSDEMEFDISTVRIKVGNSDGYAVLSTDDRLDKVFYYTDNGSLADTAKIAPLKEYIDMIPKFAAREIVEPDLYADTRAAGDEDVLIEPIVPFQWGQGAPFNLLAPECKCNRCDGHMPIGCVTTAVAQTLATISKINIHGPAPDPLSNLGTFNGTYYGCKNIDFKKFPNRIFGMTEEQRTQISHFFHEIALCCQVKFECGGSGSSIKAAYHYIKDLGFTCMYTEGAIDCDRLIRLLSLGCPHLIAGASDNGGHMWVIDGFKRIGSQIHFNCNWGWYGDSDGWSYGNPYTTSPTDGRTPEVFSKNLRHVYLNWGIGI